MEKENKQSRFGAFHDKNYKILLLIPLIVFVLSITSIVILYNETGDFLRKDITLTGGTSVTIDDTIDDTIDINELKNAISPSLDSVRVREISDILTQKRVAVIIQTKSDSDLTKQILEDYLGYELTSENSSFEFTGSTLSDSFFKQLIIAIFFAFILMSLVVFVLFRSFIPSLAVIISAIADILMTLAVVNFFEIEMSSAGIVAFLMLIGYSVDTDILLTNRVLNRSGNLNEKIFGAFKTGLTMTLTSLVAVLIALFAVKSISPTLAQIFLVLSIGLVFDIFNTWTTNVSILKWYMVKKGGGING
jgi:preprotein translocase subunit SecF